MRIAAPEITEALVGHRLVEFSHVGEDPASDERGFDRVETLGGRGYRPVIVAVRLEDPDNHVAILLEEIITQLARDDQGHAYKDESGNWVMVPTVPPQGRHEIGFDANGWIEVED